MVKTARCFLKTAQCFESNSTSFLKNDTLFFLKQSLNYLDKSKTLCCFAAQTIGGAYMFNRDELNTMNRFSSFFQENREQFFAFAYSYLRDRAEAEDIFMDSMITLWEHRDSWEEGKPLQALLLTIIKNKALNLLESRQLHLHIEEELYEHRSRELNLRISTLKECNPDYLFSDEIQRIVKHSLAKMSHQSREIFTLSRINNLSNKDIAKQMNVSLKTVEYHITKTLRTLRTELKDYLPLLFL